MKAKTLLRIAAVLMLLHTAGHTIGALTWKQTSNTAMKRVVEGLALGFFLVFLSVMELIYFFPVAAAFSLLAGISTFFAYTKSKAL